MTQFVRSFGNSTTPAIHGSTYGTYYNLGSVPKREDAFTGYRTTKERFCQDYPSPRRGLTFQNTICVGLDEYGCDDRNSGGRHNGGLIRNAVLEEICFDYPPLYLFEMDCHSSAAEMTRIPDYLSDVDEIISFGTIGKVEEMLTQQGEKKHVSNGVLCGAQKPNNAVINILSEGHREKGQNPRLPYANLDQFSRKGSKAYDLNEAVASPTISSSCEPEMVLSSSGLSQPGIILNDGSAVRSTNNSMGVPSESLEESRGRDREPDPLDLDRRTSGSDAALYSGSLCVQTSPAPPPAYQDATSLVLPPSTCAIDACSRERNKPRSLQPMKKLDSSNDDSLEAILYSSSVSSAAKLEKALPSELINVKGDGLMSSYGVLEQPRILAEGEESNATSTSTSPSQIHAAKKQRFITCASDLLEDLKDSYAFTKGANPFAPAVHPTFTDPMIRSEMQRPYCFQPPPRNGALQASFVCEQPINFNFGATAPKFRGICATPRFQHKTPSGINRSLLGDEYCNYNGVRSNNVMTPSSRGDMWFNNGRQLMRSSPGTYQSCPDLSSPEDTPENLDSYSSAQINDSSCYGQPRSGQVGFNSNVLARQGQPMAYYDKDDYLLSPVFQFKQHTSSAPNTPSKHGNSGQFPFQEAAHLQRLPSDHSPMSFQNRTPVHKSLHFQRTISQMLLPNRNTSMNYFDPVPSPSIQFASDVDPVSHTASPFCNTPPRMHCQPLRSTPMQRPFDVLDSSYNCQSADTMFNIHHNVPLTQQKFMQRLIREDSNAFKSHPLFPLLRDIIITDTNFHTPKFPFALVAHLPTDFGRLLHNYVTRNPGVNLDQGDPAVHSFFMEGLKFAHSALISKIQERKMREGYLDFDPPLANIKDICDSFTRSVKPEGSYGSDSSCSRGLMTGDACLMPEYSCMPSINGVELGTGSRTSQQSAIKLPDYSASSSYTSVECSYRLSPSVSFGLNTPQNVYPEGDRVMLGLSSSSPKKLINQGFFVGEKDQINHGTETAGEKIGKNKVLPRESVSIMLDWLREHQDNPYPNDDEKDSLIASTKLNITQINYWFTNARRRILPKWALQRHTDEREKAQKTSAATCSGIRPNNSPMS